MRLAISANLLDFGGELSKGGLKKPSWRFNIR